MCVRYELLNNSNHPLDHLISDNIMLLLNSALSVSPLQYSRAVLVDQRLVVRLELLDGGQLSGLCVEVEFAVEGM